MSTKTITINLSAWPSKYYPVQAKFKLGMTNYHMVFESYDQAQSHFRQRFYPMQVKFKIA